MRATVMLVALILVPAVARADILLDDFEDVTDWTGLDLETTITRSGAGAGRWEDHPNQSSIRKIFSAPLDLSSERHLRFWVHSAVANGAGVQVILDSDDPDSPDTDYYSTKLIADWVGWRLVKIPFEEFSVSRAPLGWHQIKHVLLSAGGWSNTPLPDTLLIFDDMWFGRGVVDHVQRESAWSGGDYRYSYEVTLKERAGHARTLSLEFDTPSGYPFAVAVTPATVSLPAGGTATVVATVTLSAAALAGEAPLTSHPVNLLVVEEGSIMDVQELPVAVPLPFRQSPRAFLEEADFARIATWSENATWAAGQRDRILAAATGWPESYEEAYSLSSWALPPEGGQWGQWYVCPTHAVSLTWQGNTNHVCPIDGEVFTGWPYDQVIYSRRHTALSRAARDLGLAYQITGDAGFAASAAEILLAYADAYPGYAIHNKDGEESRSGARVLSQTLDESIWLIGIAWAYDLIVGSGVMSDAERHHVEENLLRASVATIRRNTGTVGNWQSWHNTGIGAVGFAIDDPVLQALVVTDPKSGFEQQMGASVTADGFWWEGSWGYHFYALSALWQLAEMATRAGYDLWAQAPLRAMFTEPLAFAMPDWSMPLFNDSKYTSLSDDRVAYEVAYHRTGDPTLASVLDKYNRPREALFFGSLELPPPDESLAPTSRLFKDSGFAVLRAENSDDPLGQVYLALDFGPHGSSHGHYDKLGFVYFARGQVMAVDPGTQTYGAPVHATWDKMTVAHNTVVVDEGVQAATTGTLRRFATLPGVSFVAADAAESWESAEMLRTMVLTPDYVLERSVVRATDNAAHAYDWILHSPGTVSTPLDTTAYSDLPSDNGYQHLEGTRSALTDDEWEAVFDMNLPPTNCGRVLSRSADGIVASMSCSQEEVAGGIWASRMDYDFSADSGTVLYSVPDPPEVTDVPSGLRLALYGDNSGNTLVLRVYDTTEERFRNTIGPIDWTGWRILEVTDLPSWSTSQGNADGVFDPPAKRVVLQLTSVDGAAKTGTLCVDDVVLLYPDGDVPVADFEVPERSMRVRVLSEPGTRVVTGTGVGPNPLVPVPFVMARRQAQDATFHALLEPFGAEPQVTSFAAAQTNAEAGDEAAAFRVDTSAWSDRVLAVADGVPGTLRSFGGVACDGVLCLVRDHAGTSLRLSLAEGRVIEGDTRPLLQSEAALAGIQADFTQEGRRLDLHVVSAAATELRVLGPDVITVRVDGADTPFTRDEDYVVLGIVPVDPDGGVGQLDGGVDLDGGVGQPDGGSLPHQAEPTGTGDGCGCRAGQGSATAPRLAILVLTLLGAGWLRRRRPFHHRSRVG